MSFKQDPYDECFAKVTPPKNHTFSHRRRPCRFEPSLQSPTGLVPGNSQNASQDAPLHDGSDAGGDQPSSDTVPAQRCPFEENEFCTRVEQSNLPAAIAAAYSERIKNVQSEPSTSVVIRSEQQFNGRDLERFAQRRHMYEVVADGAPDDDENRFGVGCSNLDRGDRLGEYNGFMDLRSYYTRSPLALGLLVAPSWVREDPKIFVMQGDYGPLFGAHSFRSTVYAMQDPKTIGAKCAQMCAIMALGMLADRGVEVRGSFTLTYLSWFFEHQRDIQRHNSNPKKRVSPVGSFFVDGLRPAQLQRVLAGCGVNAGASNISVRTDSDEEKCSDQRLATRLIAANVYARFPIIMAVDVAQWKKAINAKGTDESSHPKAHAVTIVGMRRSHSGQANALLLHDPGSGPFKLVDLEKALRAASAYGGNGKHRIRLIVAATQSIKYHASRCVAWLQANDQREAGESPSEHSLNESANSLPGIDFGPFRRCESDYDYRIRLLNRNTIAKYLLALVDPSEENVLRELKNGLSDSRFWVVVGISKPRPVDIQIGDLPNDKVEPKETSLQVAWIFDARGDGKITKVYRSPRLDQLRIEMSIGQLSDKAATPETETTGSQTQPLRFEKCESLGDLKADELLRPAVMTSASERSIADLTYEIDSVSDVRTFDLMIARRIDLQRFGISLNGENPFSKMSQVVADPATFQLLRKRFGEIVEKQSSMSVSAIATYFPDISSNDPVLRETAIQALANTVILAIDLNRKHVSRVPHAIVEAVCGSVLDAPTARVESTNDAESQAAPPPDGRRVYGGIYKVNLLMQSLHRVIEIVKQTKGYDDAKFAIALEMEPGDTYVLNGLERMLAVQRRIKQAANMGFDHLSQHLGFNVDIAHLRIAEVEAAELMPLRDRIVHAHISDHPGMHTHDQTIGSWTNIHRNQSGYTPYLELLASRAATRDGVLPFSGAVAIELEGCNRIFAIHDSLARLKHAIRNATFRYLQKAGWRLP